MVSNTNIPTPLIGTSSIARPILSAPAGRVVTEIVSVAGVPDAEGFTEPGLNAHVVPAGLLQLNVTGSTKPL